jgi:hypothetical protein
MAFLADPDTHTKLTDIAKDRPPRPHHPRGRGPPHRHRRARNLREGSRRPRREAPRRPRPLPRHLLTTDPARTRLQFHRLKCHWLLVNQCSCSPSSPSRSRTPRHPAAGPQPRQHHAHRLPSPPPQPPQHARCRHRLRNAECLPHTRRHHLRHTTPRLLRLLPDPPPSTLPLRLPPLPLPLCPHSPLSPSASLCFLCLLLFAFPLCPLRPSVPLSSLLRDLRALRFPS